MFLQVEEAGGMVKSIFDESVQNAVNASNKARHEAVSKRKEILLGTNQYPNFNELAGEKTPSDTNVAVVADIITKKKLHLPNWKPAVLPANLKLYVCRQNILVNVQKLSC